MRQNTLNDWVGWDEAVAVWRKEFKTEDTPTRIKLLYVETNKIKMTEVTG